MLFTGTATHGDVPVRKLIQKMCNGYKDISVCTFKSFTRESASLKAKARFCLEPGGDSPFRKSISDSMAMGCIPVVFSNITAEVAPWHWGGWRALGQVHIPRVDFLAGKYDLAALLRAQPSEMAKESTAAVAINAKKWMFATRMHALSLVIVMPPPLPPLMMASVPHCLKSSNFSGSGINPCALQ